MLFLKIAISILPTQLIGQSDCPKYDCPCILVTADSLAENFKTISKAINTYTAYKICAPDSTKVADARITKLFQKIEKLYQKAEVDKLKLEDVQADLLLEDEKNKKLIKQIKTKNDSLTTQEDKLRDIVDSLRIMEDSLQNTIYELKVNHSKLAGDAYFDAQNNLEHLYFGKALSNCKTIDSLQLWDEKDFDKQILQELAYFFNEVDYQKKALEALRYAGINLKKNYTPTEISKAIIDLDAVYFQQLKKRYHPQMIKIKGGYYSPISEFQLLPNRNRFIDFSYCDHFEISETTVTYAQYAVYSWINRNGIIPRYSLGINLDSPVECTYNEAIAYLNWRSNTNGWIKYYEEIKSKKYDSEILKSSLRRTWIIIDSSFSFRLPYNYELNYIGIQNGNHIIKNKNHDLRFGANNELMVGLNKLHDYFDFTLKLSEVRYSSRSILRNSMINFRLTRSLFNDSYKENYPPIYNSNTSDLNKKNLSIEMDLNEYFSKKIKLSKKIKKDSVFRNSLNKTIYVKFDVKENGEKNNIKLLKRFHPVLDKKIVEVIKQMPPWIPSKENGVPVKDSVALLFQFNPSKNRKRICCDPIGFYGLSRLNNWSNHSPYLLNKKGWSFGFFNKWDNLWEIEFKFDQFTVQKDFIFKDVTIQTGRELNLFRLGTSFGVWRKELLEKSIEIIPFLGSSIAYSSLNNLQSLDLPAKFSNDFGWELNTGISIDYRNPYFNFLVLRGKLSYDKIFFMETPLNVGNLSLQFGLGVGLW